MPSRRQFLYPVNEAIEEAIFGPPKPNPMRSPHVSFVLDEEEGKDVGLCGQLSKRTTWYCMLNNPKKTKILLFIPLSNSSSCPSSCLRPNLNHNLHHPNIVPRYKNGLRTCMAIGVALVAYLVPSFSLLTGLTGGFG